MTDFVRQFDNAVHGKFLAIGPFPNYRKHPSNIPGNALKKVGAVNLNKNVSNKLEFRKYKFSEF